MAYVTLVRPAIVVVKWSHTTTRRVAREPRKDSAARNVPGFAILPPDRS